MKNGRDKRNIRFEYLLFKTKLGFNCTCQTDFIVNFIVYCPLAAILKEQ